MSLIYLLPRKEKGLILQQNVEGIIVQSLLDSLVRSAHLQKVCILVCSHLYRGGLVVPILLVNSVGKFYSECKYSLKQVHLASDLKLYISINFISSKDNILISTTDF